ncbi:signal transduction histidine kinase [Serinibacter salmoneus]|uniref:histidine kinase n=2 Tax=Serinibacter salmoneus TaxID=556530 RepID=A0A2A9CVR6_9MICO|nr:signal transduction histidine kinase [Serinibacter salmoneus]
MGTVAAAVIVAFMGMVFAAVPSPTEGVRIVWHALGLLGALGLGVAMIWRIARPVLVLVLTSLGAILLPLDPIGPAIALNWVVARAPRHTLIWTVPLGLLGIVVPFWRDPGYGADAVLSVAPEGAAGAAENVPPGAGWYLLWALVVLLPAVAIGLVRRSQAQTRLAQARTAASEQRSHHLRGELSRQEERELIAREMHDTVAHHLSVLSLRAASMEATSSDPTVPEHARALRTSAHQALEEMRTLITSLRDSADGGYVGSAPTLATLGALVEEASRAGVTIDAHVDVPADPPAPQGLTRAAYRIVQEALTNAMKHAPGSGVAVRVTGVPGAGVTLVVSNWLPRTDARGEGSRAGIIGMTERATALGGVLTSRAEGEIWVVRAWLPWREER